MLCGNTSGIGPDCRRPLIIRRSPVYGLLHVCPLCDGPAADPAVTNPRNNRPPTATEEADTR